MHLGPWDDLQGYNHGSFHGGPIHGGGGFGGGLLSTADSRCRGNHRVLTKTFFRDILSAHYKQPDLKVGHRQLCKLLTEIRCFGMKDLFEGRFLH